MVDVLLLNIHMERAAGTAVHAYLRQSIGGYYILTPPRALASNEPDYGISDAMLAGLVRFTPGLVGLGGHSLRPWCQPPDGRFGVSLTVLRHPIDRFLSHLSLHNRFSRRPWSVEEFCADRRMWNWQTVKLAGWQSLVEARAALASLDCVGLHDGLSSFAPELIGHLGLVPRGRLDVMNSSDSRLDWADLTMVERRLVERANALDLELYEGLTSGQAGHHLSDRSEGKLRGANRTASPEPVARFRQRLWSLFEATALRSSGRSDFGDVSRLVSRRHDLFPS